MNPSSLEIHGLGVVSPAGFGAGAILQLCREGETVPRSQITRQLGEKEIRTPVSEVPHEALSQLPKHPRLRRASPITRFSTAAAFGAIDDAGLKPEALGDGRTGLILCMMNGCVAYTNRFFGEVIENPEFASPLVFPETVFNAPASHLATLLGIDGPTYTVVGDTSAVLDGLQVAEFWIAAGLIDRCLLVSAEEKDWLNAEALGYYHRDLVLAEGAGCLLLGPPRQDQSGILVSKVAGPHAFLRGSERAGALGRARAELGDHLVREARLLVDGCRGPEPIDRPEIENWANWSKPRISPARHLGDALGASSIFQLIVAAASLGATGGTALVSMPGGNRQAGVVALKSFPE